MKLIEISLYDLHKDPKSLYGYDKADTEVPDVFWDKYKNNPEELKKREKYIAKSAEYSYYYARDIIKGRWPEGEDAIATSPEFAYYYARNIIKRRFPEGEKAIAKDPKFAYYYARNISKGISPEGKKAIAKDPWYAYLYASNVIKGRFPEGEKAIAKNHDTKKAYEEQFGVKL